MARICYSSIQLNTRAMKKILFLFTALLSIHFYVQAQTDSTRVSSASEQVISNEPPDSSIDKEPSTTIALRFNLADAEYDSWDNYYSNVVAQSYASTTMGDQSESSKVKKRNEKRAAKIAYYSYPEAKLNPE